MPFTVSLLLLIHAFSRALLYGYRLLVPRKRGLQPALSMAKFQQTTRQTRLWLSRNGPPKYCIQCPSTEEAEATEQGDKLLLTLQYQ
jgi:hypothetical protein